MCKLATHSGPQHADDQVAAAILTSVLPKATLIRSRDAETLANCNFRFDVGGRYDEATGDFDHHQRGGAGVRENGVPYAAAGLVWKHFGEQFSKPYAEKYGVDLKALHAEVDRHFIQGIDAMDTGSVTTKHVLESTEAKVFVTSLSQAVELFNPDGFIEDASPEAFDRAFQDLLPWTKRLLERAVIRTAGRLKAKEYILSQDQGSEILLLERNCNWQEVVSEQLEHVRFVVLKIQEEDWRVQGVPEVPGSFSLKRELPEQWAGMRDSDLQKVSEVPDATFCHPGRFIAGAKSKAGALALANKAIL